MAAPWLKFYPTDWRADPALRVCSLAARGLWQEMLCIMHEATPYGYLVINGKPVVPKQLAVLVGAPLREVEGCLKELDENAVYSRDDNGVIYSRRMVRDAAKAERDKTNGKGGGNPKLKPSGPAVVNPSRAKKHERGLTPPLTHPPLSGDNTQSQTPDNPESEKTTQQPLSSELRANDSKSLISPEANTIADAIGQAAGFSKENWPPGWCGAAYKIQNFLNEGCPGDLLRDTAIAIVRRKRDGPPDNFSYFDKPIATAFANHKRPLPTVVITGNQTIEAPAHARKRTIIDAADDLIAKLNALDGSTEAGGGTCAPPLRILPPQ